MEVSEIFMTYISKSDEQPLGKVEDIWWRHEYHFFWEKEILRHQLWTRLILHTV
jgi:hypothetical protein